MSLCATIERQYPIKQAQQRAWQHAHRLTPGPRCFCGTPAVAYVPDVADEARCLDHTIAYYTQLLAVAQAWRRSGERLAQCRRCRQAFLYVPTHRPDSGGGHGGWQRKERSHRTLCAACYGLLRRDIAARAWHTRPATRLQRRRRTRVPVGLGPSPPDHGAVVHV